MIWLKLRVLVGLKFSYKKQSQNIQKKVFKEVIFMVKH